MVGVLITFAFIVAIGGTLWLARKGVGATYTLYSRFRWGAGLKVNQPVLFAGIQIGTVDKIDINPNGFLDVVLKIEKERKIPDGTLAKVEQTSFFGDKAVALDPPTRLTGAWVQPGDTLPAAPPAPSIDDLLARVDSISRGVADMTETIQIEFVRGGGIADLRKTIASMNELAGQLNTVAAVQSRNLSATMASFRHTLTAIDSAAIDSTLKNLRTTSERVTALTGDFQQTSTRLNGILGKLESGDGTAAKLLNDPGLYYDLRALMMQADSLIADVKRNPKRYINVKVF